MIASHPSSPRTTCRIIVIALLVCTISGLARASDRAAAKRVREGVRLHQAGDFEQAAKVFSKAAETLPANLRVAFNRGSALAAQGKHDEAESLLREAALAQDSDLAAAAFYNLGCLTGDQLKTLFGDEPEEAVGETRENGMLLVRTAVDHYRSALRVNSEHTASRRNLELLRIWSKHIQDRWAQRDRQQRRDEMDLFEFLAWIQDEQRETRGLVKALPDKLDSPTLRQTARKLAATQRELTREIEPLKVKLDKALEPPPQQASQPPATNVPNGPPPALSPQMLQARKVLHGLADDAGAAMSRAADGLAKRDVAGAVVAQTDVLRPLNQLFELLSPFEAILQTAIKSETALVETSTRASAGGSASPIHGTEFDFEAAAEDQRFVSSWTQILMRKAEQLLVAAESVGDAATGDATPTEIPLPTVEPDIAPNPLGDAAVDSAKIADATLADPTSPPADPKAAYRKALELGPRIEILTSEAAADLDRQAWSTALPKQAESLKLLKEIAALLPPQEQENEENKDQDQENQDDEQKKDEEQDGKQDEESDDEQKKKQDQKDPQQKKDDADKQKSNKEKEASQKEQTQPQEDLSRQKAESLLRQVRERERQHREIEKEIRRLLQSRVFVEKDW